MSNFFKDDWYGKLAFYGSKLRLAMTDYVDLRYIFDVSIITKIRNV